MYGLHIKRSLHKSDHQQHGLIRLLRQGPCYIHCSYTGEPSFFLPLSIIFFHLKNEAAHKERLKHKVFVRFDYLLCSQVWLPTVQDVLHADWQDVWHSPHPPFFTVFCNVLFVRVLICFILSSS